MGRTKKFGFATLASVSLICAATPSPAGEITLRVGITGSNSLQGLQDPVTVAKLPQVSLLLQAVADEPRSAAYIERSLEGSAVTLARLEDLSLLKVWQGRYAIAFNYLTLEDQVLLKRVLEPFAESLARAYRDRWPELDALFSAYDAAGVPDGEVAYAVIGAMSLDWDGLELTAGKGLRVTAERLPAGRDFLLWAKEQSADINTRGLYWGSHNSVAGGVQFTTFGDHHTLPRIGLPDLIWRMNKHEAELEDMPESLRQSIRAALAPDYRDEFLQDAGAVLRLLRQGPATGRTVSASTGISPERSQATLGLLQDLQYLHASEGSYSLAHPHFSQADKAMLDAVRALSRELMEKWLDQHGNAVRDSLADLNGLRYGIPYRQLFTEIWHYLFGMVNRELVRSGHFADPYAEDRLSRGMIPFAFDADLMQPFTEAGD